MDYILSNVNTAIDFNVIDVGNIQPKDQIIMESTPFTSHSCVEIISGQQTTIDNNTKHTEINLLVINCTRDYYISLAALCNTNCDSIHERLLLSVTRIYQTSFSNACVNVGHGIRFIFWSSNNNNTNDDIYNTFDTHVIIGKRQIQHKQITNYKASYVIHCRVNQYYCHNNNNNSCNNNNYFDNERIIQAISNYSATSRNNNTDGMEYLNCLSSDNDDKTFNYQTMINITSNIDLADELHSYVYSFIWFDVHTQIFWQNQGQGESVATKLRKVAKVSENFAKYATHLAKFRKFGEVAPKMYDNRKYVYIVVWTRNSAVLYAHFLSFNV